jgi:NAD(P)H dehydrogenase (quinone)
MQHTLVDKPAAVFCSTASHHGGQESTLLSMMLPLLHHGMIISGVPYSVDAINKTVTGGSPYGASHVAGSAQNPTLSADEEAIAHALGLRLARIAGALT